MFVAGDPELESNQVHQTVQSAGPGRSSRISWRPVVLRFALSVAPTPAVRPTSYDPNGSSGSARRIAGCADWIEGLDKHRDP